MPLLRKLLAKYHLANAVGVKIGPKSMLLVAILYVEAAS
jgi:hypothetical protein